MEFVQVAYFFFCIVAEQVGQHVFLRVRLVPSGSDVCICALSVISLHGNRVRTFG